MGTQTIIFGYIELPDDSISTYEQAVGKFEFDKRFPFRQVFSRPRKGYRAHMVSFTDSLKATAPEWTEWVARFEELLLQTGGLSARVHFEDDESQARLSYSYLKSDGRWLRWKIVCKESETDETIL